MAAGAMAAMDMASALLMPMPTTAGEDTALTVTESVQLMLRLTMAAGAMVATDMARDPLMPMPTTAGEAMVAMDMARDPLTPMPTTAGEAMAATDMASALLQSTAISNCPDLNLN